MTLDNCKRLLAHFEKTKQDEAAEDMRRNIKFKEQVLGVKAEEQKKKA